ncbi:regulatory LuxR family protein [Pseudonocardia autotrophica]|uniref:Transcriptional regulatory protein DegU n=1 Tax=Pseudonocardia autotrophica TaxID=2074 RepID=A0A1Y2N0Z3_PSEAH|nr:Transcriptional regulatory protein DegU [Pseudonocardia autotrophica]TDN73939.1 regulatory LuxR family protein [Pseudonocardia autotrophica]
MAFPPGPGEVAPGPGPALLGRVAELGRLQAELAGAVEGRAGAVLLAGDAGIGKSRLAGELATAASAAGITVVVGRCLDTGPAPLPYLPFSEVLAGLPVSGRELLTDRPALRGLVPGSGPPPEDVAADRELDRLAVFDGVAGALRAAAAQAPVLVVLEDLHWADRSSRELLSYLLARLGSQRLLVLATYRSDDLHRRHPLRRTLAELVRLPAVRRLELGPLPAADVLALVRHHASTVASPLPEETLHRIADRSGGNAFFAEEMVAAGRAELPEALADVLLTRLDQLSDQARVVLQVASLAERRIPHDLLRDAAELSADELAAGLREAVSHHVLVPVRTDDQDAYAFRHALLREAVHDDLLPGERVRRHARLAELLAARGDEPGTAADLARHAVAAHDLPRALAASVLAAREAQRRHGPAEALVHIERALELWPAVPDPVRVAGVAESVLLRDAAWVAGAAGDPERATALGALAVRVADEREGPSARADTRIRYAMRLLDRGTGVEEAAIGATETAIGLLAGTPPGPDLAWAHAVLARTLVNADRPEPAWPHARTALEVVGGTDRAALTGPERRDLLAAHADALITLAFCAQVEGDPAGARELLAQAAELAAAAGSRTVELRTVWTRGVSLLEEGLLDAAAAEFDDGSRRAAGYGLSWVGYGLDFQVVQARVEFQRGGWDAVTRITHGIDPTVPVQVTGVLAAAGALVTVARGELDDAERLLELLAAEPPPHDQIPMLLGMVGVEAACLRDDPGLAARRARAAIDEVARELPSHLGQIALCALGAGAQADLAVAARAEGKPDSTFREAAAELLTLAEQVTGTGLPRGTTIGPEGRAWLGRARAEVGRAAGSSDPAAWTAVVDTFAGYGDDYRAAQARLRRAAALLDRAVGAGRGPAAGAADRRAAAEDLAVAAGTAQRLGAAPLASAVAELAGRAGEGVPSGGPARPSPFTPREHAVLEQVAHGLTNRAIGERLFISEKTVSVHLSRVMAKLGASGRTEAVSLAHARGLIGRLPDQVTRATE